MIKYRLYLFFLVAIFAQTTKSQEIITGVVLDSKGKPAKRIEMQLKGRIKTIRTSSKGTFELKNVKVNDTLFVYPTKKQMAAVPLIGSPTCTFHLGENSLVYAYDNKTIICYYSEKPKRMYNSDLITEEQIMELDANNLIDILRGNIAGLQIDYVDGKAKALIRGGTSLALSNEPLFIIGGTEYHSLEEANNAISIQNIREIEVKKDGSQYGMKGANGVIIIKTR